MLHVYQAERCPFSHLVRQRLTELGVDFVAHQVEPLPEQRDAMDAAVASRVIPVVVLDDGTVLDDDAAGIVAQLDRRLSENTHSRAHHERRLEARYFE